MAIVKNKKVLIDVVLNITAAAVPIAILQLFIYPHVAPIVGSDEYGLMVTIYSVWIMISNSLGNVLNNIKLLTYSDYQKNNEEGDIALLLRQWIGLSSVIVFFVIWVYCGDYSFAHVVVGTVVAALILLKAYLEVGFRIKLNYYSILINNLLLGLGYGIGYVLFTFTGIWELIFLIGYGLSCIFCAIKTDLLKEKAQRTSMHEKVKKDSYSLVISAIITNLINYADKLVLYPLMGGTAVSIYYTATIIGKITGMITGPINSVILSYISRWDNSKINFFSKVIVIGCFVASFGYIATLLLAKPVIGYLFPQWLDEVMEIIPLTTITIMLNVFTSILQPFVLKYCNIQWQIIISALGSGTYFIFALLFWRIIGLKGFCIGTIIGVAVKLIVMVFVYYSNAKRYISGTIE